MVEYRFSNKAIRDLDGILDYTLQKFGTAQAEKYVDQLKKHIIMLAENSFLAPLRKEFSPPVRIYPSGGHLIVFEEANDCILIVRIVHTKMNLKRLFP